MARYRKVDPRIWNDQKFRSLSDKAKLVFFMLLTHPSMTALGAMRATQSGLAEELGWDAKAFREAFREVLSKGMAKHDEDACLVLLPNFLKYNPPESPNVVKAWMSAVDLLPECELKTLVLQSAKAFAEGLSEAFREALPKAFLEAFAKGMPYQEQEQKLELKQDARTRTAFARPTVEEVTAYCRERGNSVNPQAWYDHYTANGWRVGRNPMKDWQAAVRQWERNGFQQAQPPEPPPEKKRWVC